MSKPTYEELVEAADKKPSYREAMETLRDTRDAMIAAYADPAHVRKFLGPQITMIDEMLRRYETSKEKGDAAD